MPSYSNLTIAGHLGRNAVTKDAGTSRVTEFSVAFTTKKKGEETTTWIDCAFWGSRGENLAQYLTKGTAVIVGGEFMARPYNAKDGTEKLSLDLNVSTFGFAEKAGEKEETPPTPGTDAEKW
jgi:single-strand DNA-binding protein